MIRHQRAGLIYNYARHALYWLRTSARLLIGSRRSCNLCGYQGRFLPFGYPPRLDAKCPKCGSLERHRLIAMWLMTHESDAKSRDILHFAPERPVERVIRAMQPNRYVTADISQARADIKIDIERIDLPEKSFDMIICSHVLEHVNDRMALREMHRVLRNGGILLVMTPVVEGWNTTFDEDAARRMFGAIDHLRHFGQDDHVRLYGRDLRDRLREPGFDVSEFTSQEPEVTTHGLLRGETLFICRKS